MINSKKKHNGILLFDKPENISSAQALNKIKQKLGIKKAGHCGTLDPFASGLLIICFGKATKTVRYISALPKKYTAKIKFGEERDSYDITGTCIKKSDKQVNINELENILTMFTGEIYQTPPIFSAIKVNGKRSYTYARKGINISLTPRKINIYKCLLQSFENNEAILKIECSQGTYIRSLACDIGRKTGAFAYLHSLRRTAIGDFSVNNKITMNQNSTEKKYENSIISIEDALNFLPSLKIKEKEKGKIKLGQNLNKEMFKARTMSQSNIYKIYSIQDEQNKVLAIVDNKLRYLNVFATYEDNRKP